jgi:predicted kinase
VARHLLFAAALLHDVGKPKVTAEEDGRIRSRGHALLGARMARRILAEDVKSSGPDGTPFALREAVVGLVRHHGLPGTFLGKPDPQRAVITAAVTARCDWLAVLAEADTRGRICAGRDDAVERARLFAEYANECGCARGPYAFASAQSRFKYFRSADAPPTLVMPDRFTCEVTVLSGLPASGKDRWAKAHAAERPVISLDEIRAEMKVDPEEDQGPVLIEAKERAKVLLRARADFVWNATNTTKMLREGLVNLFAAYGARVAIVYCEPPWPQIRARNVRRVRPVPERVMENLFDRLDVPDATEAHEVVYVV